MKTAGGRATLLVLGLVATGCDQEVWEDENRSPVSVASPELPVLACPAGWWIDDEGPGCEPWPETGRRDDCAFDEAHFPGRPGCERIGTECAADGWPTGLPTDQPVTYVDDDAPAGGDGTRERPYATIRDASSAPGATIVAIATGTYGGAMANPGQTLWGACVDGTRLTGRLWVEPDATVRNLGIESPDEYAIYAPSARGIVEDVVAYGGGHAGVRGGGTFRRVVVRDIRPDGEQRGIGFSLYNDATLDHVVVQHTRYAAIDVSELADVSIRDLAVLDTRRYPGVLVSGNAISVESGSVVIERAILEDSDWEQVRLLDGSVDAADLLVRGSARGIVAADGGTISLSRVQVERAGPGLVAADGGEIQARDVVIRDANEEGYGALARGGTIVLERLLVERVPRYGIASEGRIEGHDLTIRDVAPAGPELPWPFGIGLWAHGTVDVTRVLVERTVYAGVAAVDLAWVTLEDLTVSDVGVSPCAATSCGEWSGGFGIFAHLSPDVTIRRFAIRGAHECGVLVSGGLSEDAMSHPYPFRSRMLLEDGEVAGSATGACLQIDGFDTSTLRNNVAYRDVGVSHRVTAYSLPDELAR